MYSSDFSIFISLIFIVFGILQIILFFKLWGMANNIKSIKKQYQVNQFFIDAEMAYLNGDTETAKDKLQKSFNYDLSIIHLSIRDEQARGTACYHLRDRYKASFEKLGIELMPMNKLRDLKEFL